MELAVQDECLYVSLINIVFMLDSACGQVLVSFTVIESLTLSMLGKISEDNILKYFFYFPRKQDLTFHANCLLRRQFAWNVKT